MRVGKVSEDPALRRDLLWHMAQGSWVGNYHHVFSKAPLSRITYMTCAITNLAHLAMYYGVCMSDLGRWGERRGGGVVSANS